MSDWVGWATRSLGLEYKGFIGFTGLFDLVTGTFLGLTVTLEADIAVLPFFLVAVNSFRVEV